MKTFRTAADFGDDDTIDVGARQVAAVYAKALLGATEPDRRTDAVLEEFDSLVTDIFDKFPKLEAVLGSALIPPDEKSALLDRLLSGKASPLFLNFLKVLAHHGRLNVLRDVRKAAIALLDQLRGKLRVRVTSAAPLEADQQGELTELLRKLLDGEPVVQMQTDPELLGGLVVRVGDRVYDGSVASRLEKVREQMIHRSVHEIQSRRDRFRSAEGN